MSDQTAISRILSLLRILAYKTHERDVASLAEYFKTSVKTVRRDIQELKSNGVPVSEDTGPFNRKTYSIHRDELPPLHLTYDEALAVFLGKVSMSAFAETELAQSATSAFEKLRLTLGESQAKYVDKLLSRIHFTKVERTGVGNGGVVDDLIVAIEDNRAIFIEYTSAKSTEPLTYDIYPYGMAHHKGSLYVVGYSRHHSAVRTWKVDRIHSTELTLFTFQRPADFDISRYFEGAFAVVGGDSKHLIRIRIEGSAVRYVCEKRFHPSQTNEMQSDGSVIVQFLLASLLEIRSWVLSFGAAAQVLEPEELRMQLRHETEQMAKIYSSKQWMKTQPTDDRNGNLP